MSHVCVNEYTFVYVTENFLPFFVHVAVAISVVAVTFAKPGTGSTHVLFAAVTIGYDVGGSLVG